MEVFSVLQDLSSTTKALRSKFLAQLYREFDNQAWDDFNVAKKTFHPTEGDEYTPEEVANLENSVDTPLPTAAASQVDFRAAYAQFTDWLFGWSVNEENGHGVGLHAPREKRHDNAPIFGGSSFLNGADSRILGGSAMSMSTCGSGSQLIFNSSVFSAGEHSKRRRSTKTAINTTLRYDAVSISRAPRPVDMSSEETDDWLYCRCIIETFMGLYVPCHQNFRDACFDVERRVYLISSLDSEASGKAHILKRPDTSHPPDNKGGPENKEPINAHVNSNLLQPRAKKVEDKSAFALKAAELQSNPLLSRNQGVPLERPILSPISGAEVATEAAAAAAAAAAAETIPATVPQLPQPVDVRRSLLDSQVGGLILNLSIALDYAIQCMVCCVISASLAEITKDEETYTEAISRLHHLSSLFVKSTLKLSWNLLTFGIGGLEHLSGEAALKMLHAVLHPSIIKENTEPDVSSFIPNGIYNDLDSYDSFFSPRGSVMDVGGGGNPSSDSLERRSMLQLDGGANANSYFDHLPENLGSVDATGPNGEKSPAVRAIENFEKRSQFYESCKRTAVRLFPKFIRSSRCYQLLVKEAISTTMFYSKSDPRSQAMEGIGSKIRLAAMLLRGGDIEVFPKAILAHDGGVKSLVQSVLNTGLWLTGGYDGVVRIWDIDMRECVAQYAGHDSIVPEARFAQRESLIVSASFDKTVRIWNASGALLERTLRGHTDSITSCDVSPGDGKFVITGSLDCTIGLWEVATGERIRTLRRHTKFVKNVMFSPDGKYALSAGVDRKVFVWETSALAYNGAKAVVPVKCLEGHEDAILSIDVCRPSRLVTGGRDGTVRVWDFLKGVCQLNVSVAPAWACTVAFSHDGGLFAAGCFDNSIHIFDGDKGTCLRVIKLFATGILCVRFPQSQPDFIMCGTSDGYIQKIPL